jgi:hypothetical protein
VSPAVYFYFPHAIEEYRYPEDKQLKHEPHIRKILPEHREPNNGNFAGALSNIAKYPHKAQG